MGLLVSSVLVAPAYAANRDSVAAVCDAMTTPVYLSVDPVSGASRLSLSAEEAASAAGDGFTEQLGPQFAAATEAVDGSLAVNELYNERSGDYVYVASPVEVTLAKKSYLYEENGVSFYVSGRYAPCFEQVHRFRLGAYHRFAVGDEQQQELLAAGWIDEGSMFWSAPLTEQTPSPTEEPTATPSPTEEPTATPSPTEEPTATPSPTEEPTATPSPSEEPTPSPTEEPTATPPPTEEPTPSPTQEPTPSPTQEPTPTPTPAPDPGPDGAFTIAVMPDTQNEVLNPVDPRFENGVKWLVDNEQDLNLAYVTHTGDVVNWDTPEHQQYAMADEALAALTDAGIPYSLSIGNHDTAAVCPGGAACPGKNAWETVRDTSTFNEYFTAGEYGAVEGAFQSGKVDNIYSTFTAGGESWLVLNLELWPRQVVIDWAKDVVASHPDDNVIVATHSYLTGSGAIQGDNGGYGATSPQHLYDELISQYANIRIVVSGHVGTSAHRVDTGVNGNTIYSYLQGYHSGSTNPVRLLTIDVEAGTLESQVYAPYTDQYFSDGEYSDSGITW